jgi:tryptophan synthase alpha chain
MRRTIADTFASVRRAGSIALMPFVPAGYPDLDSTVEILVALERAGANLIEVGIPFSDPIADGPVIQEAFTEALARGLRVRDVLGAIAAARAEVSIPLVAMVSYSVVHRFGVDAFLSTAGSSGFDGLILPDLPPPEAEEVLQKTRAAGLDTVLLVAPTTSETRRAQIVKLCSGFAYYLSVSGITGERDLLPDDLVPNVRAIRAIGDVPVCVGFGIHRREQIEMLRGVADGAIVGSALVRRIKDSARRGTQGVGRAVEEFAASLVNP